MVVLAGVALLLVAGVACQGRPRIGAEDDAESTGHSPQGKLVELNLEHGTAETPSGAGLFASRQLSFSELTLGLERLAKASKTKGLFVRFGAAPRDWAQTQELGRLLGAVRKATIPVSCHADTLNNASLWLAAAGCDEIWLSPAGQVDAVGIAGQVMYFKGLLDRLKVRADFLHFGRYKSAVESLTEEGPTEAARESLAGVLGSLRDSWLDGMVAARDAEGIRRAVEDGPWDAEAARRLGLIDEVGYVSDAKDALEDKSGEHEFRSLLDDQEREAARELVALVRALSGAKSYGSQPRIVVLTAQGSINMEASGPWSQSGISAKGLTRTIRRLKKDDSVKAVVLRIDSPGGSALASDLLWHELYQLGSKKPLVASVGSMAASGGYYMASAAAAIVAERTSIVGSIGVFGGKIVIGEALGEYGVNGVTFPASPEPGAAERAAYLSALTPWDEPTRERVRQQMRRIYDLFVDRVAEGRSLPRDSVLRVAEGRIWSGAQGMKNQLVDELGGLDLAIERARSLAGLSDSVAVEVELGAESILEQLFLGDDVDEEQIRRALVAAQVNPEPLLGQLERDVRPFVASLQPLMRGERVLAALPFAVEIR